MAINEFIKYCETFSTRMSRKGKIRLHSFSKVKQSNGWREFRWEKNSLHLSLLLKAAKVSSMYQ